MYIGFIHPSWPGSEGTGATHSATQIVEGLAERGHKITVFCLAEPDGDGVSTADGLTLETLPGGGCHTRTPAATG